MINSAEAYAQRDEAKQEAVERHKNKQEETRHSKDRKAALRAFSVFPDGETKSALREAAGLSGNRFGPILSELISEGLVEEREIVKSNGQKYPGFRVTRTPGHSRTVRVSD